MVAILLKLQCPKGDFRLAHTIFSVSSPWWPWNSQGPTGVLYRYSVRDLAGVPMQHGASRALVWPDTVACLRCCSKRVDGTERGLEQRVGKGAETARSSKGTPG